MGLLDDAIREHLELKRRRGADASEVERQEAELLGRDAPAPPAPEPEPAGGAVSAAQFVAPEPAPAAPEPPPSQPVEPSAVEPARPEPEAWLEPEDDAPEYVAPDEELAGEDVLEETPDFLQETPEHDRLWFEQKPPRDFDFGG